MNMRLQLPGPADQVEFFKNSILLTSQGQAYLFNGIQWKSMGDAELHRDPFRSERAFLIRQGKKHYFTDDGFKSMKEWITPMDVEDPTIVWNKRESDWFLWMDKEAYAVKVNDWKELSLPQDADICEFSVADDTLKQRLICSWETSNGYVDVGWSDEWFEGREKFELISGSAVGWANVGEYSVVGEVRNAQLFLLVGKSEFHQARFADTIDLHKGYTLIGMGKTLGVDVLTSENPLMGTLYLSDGEAKTFGLSLGNTRREKNGQVDIAQVGKVLVANVIEDGKVKTMVSEDGGLGWSLLGFDMCPGDCSLHLHIQSSTFNVADHSPYLMIGGLGTELPALNDCNVYASDDAVLWRKIKDGTEFVTAIDQVYVTPSSQGIQYSFDGQKWIEEQLSNGKFMELYAPSKRNQLIAIFETNATLEAVAAKIPKSRQCTEDDIYKVESKICQFGVRNVYKRVPNTCDASGLELVPYSVPCPCEFSDYECEPRFYRNADGNCVALPEFEYVLEKCPRPSGYIKFWKSGCEGGLLLSDVPCNVDMPLQFLWVGLFFGVIFFGIYVYRRNRKEYGAIRLEDHMELSNVEESYRYLDLE